MTIMRMKNTIIPLSARERSVPKKRTMTISQTISPMTSVTASAVDSAAFAASAAGRKQNAKNAKRPAAEKATARRANAQRINAQRINAPLGKIIPKNTLMSITTSTIQSAA